MGEAAKAPFVKRVPRTRALDEAVALAKLWLTARISCNSCRRYTCSKGEHVYTYMHRL